VFVQRQRRAIVDIVKPVLYETINQAVLENMAKIDYTALHRGFPTHAQNQLYTEDRVWSGNIRGVNSYWWGSIHRMLANAAVNGDMGWKPQCVRQIKVVSNHWYRCTQMDGARLNTHIFHWASRKATGNCRNLNF
jgi:hypothetical protein